MFEFFGNCCTTYLLSKQVKFVWIDDCQLAFDTKLSYHSKNSLFLKSPDYEKPFKLIIDSSDVGTGSVLVQEASDGLDPCQLFFKEILKISKKL